MSFLVALLATAGVVIVIIVVVLATSWWVTRVVGTRWHVGAHRRRMPPTGPYR